MSVGVETNETRKFPTGYGPSEPCITPPCPRRSSASLIAGILTCRQVLRGSSHDTNYAAGVESDTTSTSSTASTTPVPPSTPPSASASTSPPPLRRRTSTSSAASAGSLGWVDHLLDTNFDAEEDAAAADVLQRQVLSTFVRHARTAAEELQKKQRYLSSFLGSSDRAIQRALASECFAARPLLESLRNALATQEQFIQEIEANHRSVESSLGQLVAAAGQDQCLCCTAALGAGLS